jgi:hypothetical protein
VIKVVIHIEGKKRFIKRTSASGVSSSPTEVGLRSKKLSPESARLELDNYVTR